MDILLISCPITDPTQPILAVPTLAAFLRAKGFDVSVWDLSIDCFNTLTSPSFLRNAVSRISDREIGDDDPLAEQYHTIQATALALAPVVIDKIELATATFRDAVQFYDFPHYRDALCVLEGAYTLLEAAYFPTQITSFTKYGIGRRQTVPNIMNHLVDSDSNVFLENFASDVLPKIEKLDPPLIGISISFNGQFLPSLTLCRLLKEHSPQVPVILGGSYLSAISDRLETEKFLWDLAAAIVLYEGESALAEICSRVKESKDLAGIPNVFLKKDRLPPQKPVRADGPKLGIHVEDVTTFPPPDFSGFPLAQYLVPELVLPVQSNRGCYWGQCAFCSSARATRSMYRQRSVQALLQDMLSVCSSTGATTFFICDALTPTDYMRQLAQTIKATNAPYTWRTEARFDLKLDDETCVQLADGGCLALTFGLESASDRVLQLMKKGTRVEDALKVLEACKKANIGVNLHSLIGFPGETVEEAQATGNFFKEHQGLYSAFTMLAFAGMEGCEVVIYPERFNVTIKDESREEIKHLYDLEVREGMSTSQALEQSTKMLAQLHLEGVWSYSWMNGNDGIHAFLYLKEFGRHFLELGVSQAFEAHELNEALCEVAPDLAIKEVSAEKCIVYTPNGCFVVLPQVVTDAIQLLQTRPQAIASVAYHFARTDSGQLDYSTFYTLEFALLNLVKLRFLRFQRTERDQDLSSS